MTSYNKFIKRVFDVFLSSALLILLFPIITVSIFLASIDTRLFGLFKQLRVGKEGVVFYVYKIRTMKNINGINTTVSTSNDVRITKLGSLFRRSKIDELPQLWNVIVGDMSFVGPRPDVEGYADKLTADDRIILTIRPGITGPASIKYKNEEEILAMQDNSQEYNDTVIWPDKVLINKDYITKYTFLNDLKYILKTVKG